MSEKLTLRVAAVPGRVVFALGDHGYPLIPTRQVGLNRDGSPWEGGEPIDARKTADDRIIPEHELYRRALLSGDIVQVEAAQPKAEAPEEVVTV